MAGTTTYFGISYPQSTDLVKDGAANMQTIATGFDSAVAIPTYNNQTGTSYTFVLLDVAKVVTASNASASTYTIPPQSSVVWTTGATLRVTNLGAGVVTFAAGAGVTVTNTAQTLAQYQSANLVRTGSDAWTVLPESGGASSLTLITTQTFTTSAAVNVNNCFTTTYKNYRIMVFNDFSADASIDFRFRASSSDNTTSNYRYNIYNPSYDGTSPTSLSGIDTTFFRIAGTSTGTQPSAYTIDCYNPQAAEYSYLHVLTAGITRAGAGGAIFRESTQFDGFSLIPTSGTITGTLRVYGYKD